MPIYQVLSDCTVNTDHHFSNYVTWSPFANITCHPTVPWTWTVKFIHVQPSANRNNRIPQSIQFPDTPLWIRRSESDFPVSGATTLSLSSRRSVPIASKSSSTFILAALFSWSLEPFNPRRPWIRSIMLDS